MLHEHDPCIEHTERTTMSTTFRTNHPASSPSAALDFSGRSEFTLLVDAPGAPDRPPFRREVPVRARGIDVGLRDVLLELVRVSRRTRELAVTFQSENYFEGERTALHILARLDGLLHQLCRVTCDVQELERIIQATNQGN